MYSHNPNHFLNEEGIDIVIDEIVDNNDFEKSYTEMETNHSIKLIKYPQVFEGGGIIILDDINEKEKNDSQVQAMLIRSRQKNLSFFITSQGYYGLPKRTVRAQIEIYIISSQQTT